MRIPPAYATPIALLLLLLPSAQVVQQPQLAPPGGIAPDTWKQASTEFRWVLYRDSMERRVTTKQAWVEFLESNRDFATLEAMCIYEGFRGVFQKGNPGEVLARLRTPHRMRVGLWNLSNFDSHNVEASASPLTKEPPVFVAWARKFPKVKSLGGAALLKKFAKVHPGEAGDLLPPLDPAEMLLPMLEAPREIARLRAGTKFDPARRYRFQVLRAIRAISVAGQFGRPYRFALLRLSRHQDPVIRRTAMLEFSQFPGGTIPWSELLAIGDNTSLDAADRSAAMLTASYSTHPAATLALHRILKSPEHPAFDAVVQRMYQLGTAMTDRVLDDLPRDGIPEARRSRVAALHKVLSKNGTKRSWNLQQLVFLNVWSEFTKDPLLPVVKAWTEPQLQAFLRGEGAEKQLRNLIANPGETGAKNFLFDAIKAEAERLLR